MLGEDEAVEAELLAQVAAGVGVEPPDEEEDIRVNVPQSSLCRGRKRWNSTQCAGQDLEEPNLTAMDETKEPTFLAEVRAALDAAGGRVVPLMQDFIVHVVACVIG